MQKNQIWIIVGVVAVVLVCLCVAALLIGGLVVYPRVKSGGPASALTLVAGSVTPGAPFALLSSPTGTAIPQTVAPTQTPTTTPVTPNPPSVDFNGIRFWLEPHVSQGTLPEIVPAAPGDPDNTMAGEIHPEYTQFTLQGYLLEDTFHKPQIFIYPIADYATMDPSSKKVVDELKVVLEQKPGQVDHMPFMPLWPAAQFLQSNIKYLDFFNGSGVRFLSQYGQAFFPVNNHDLFYTFQGITADGAWYVAAVLPVSHPSLPQGEEEFPLGDTSPEQYFANMENQLSTQPDTSFTPSLAALDAIIASIQVK